MSEGQKRMGDTRYGIVDADLSAMNNKELSNLKMRPKKYQPVGRLHIKAGHQQRFFESTFTKLNPRNNLFALNKDVFKARNFDVSYVTPSDVSWAATYSKLNNSCHHHAMASIKLLRSNNAY